MGNSLGVYAAFREFGADSNGSLPLADTGGDEGIREAGVVSEALLGEAGQGFVDFLGAEFARGQLFA